MTEKPWLRFREISLEELPPRESKWRELYYELLLRLEQTEPQYTIAVEMVNAQEADRARASLIRVFCARLGHRTVRMSVYGNTLFVSRGPGWGKAKPQQSKNGRRRTNS